MGIRDQPELVQLSWVDGEVSIVLVAEICNFCDERVRYWNDDAGRGNASCGCCQEGPEACDPIAMRPLVPALLAAALVKFAPVMPGDVAADVLAHRTSLEPDPAEVQRAKRNGVELAWEALNLVVEDLDLDGERGVLCVVVDSLRGRILEIDTEKRS